MSTRWKLVVSFRFRVLYLPGYPHWIRGWVDYTADVRAMENTIPAANSLGRSFMI